MRFRELRIEASDRIADHGVPPPGFVFRWTAHHVREIFSALLPRHFTLDGSSVVQITCGPAIPPDPQYSACLNSSVYYVENFDFAGYAAMTPSERQDCLLRVVEEALCDIARRVGADASVIKDTAQAVRDSTFRLEREVPKLRKRTPSGHSLRVFRCLSTEDGEAWYLRQFIASGTMSQEIVLEKTPNYLNRRDFYFTAEMSGSTYLLRCRLGQETFRFEPLDQSM